MIQELKAKAAEHWRTYLPHKWAQLMAEDRVDLELTKAAMQAADAIRRLMEVGMRLDEAEEIILPDFIYLKPETDGLDAETRGELSAMEEEYQQNIGSTFLEPRGQGSHPPAVIPSAD